MKVRVVKVDATVDVAGYLLGVQEVTISLAVNAIPTAEIECAPTSFSARKPLKPEVCVPGVYDYSSIYSDLSKKAEGLSEPCGLSIRISGDDNDELDLKGWILAGVGLSSVNASSAPHLVLVLQHPICKLTKVGAIYETAKSDQSVLLNSAASSASNLIEVMQAVYACARSVIQYYPSPSQYAEQFRRALGVGEFDPGKYLVCSGGIFLAKAASGMKSRIAQSIGRMVFPTSEGSIWDTIMRMCGMLLMSVTQSQDNNYTGDKLVLEPMRPWKSASISLGQDWCFSTDIPGMNPFKIIGVMCRKLGPHLSDYSLGIQRNLNPSLKAKLSNPVSEVLYVPPIKGISSSAGRIMMTPVPSVLEQACRLDAPQGQFSSGFIKSAELYADGFKSALTAYCKAVFECAAGSLVHGKARMALSIHDYGGKLILPGNTCVFNALGPMYYGYIRQVIHHMSASGGCETIVSMSHVRSTPSFMINGQPAIAAGASNAAY